MNWYKKSYKITNFKERNALNTKIREFKEIANTLAYLRKYIVQNAPHAKKIVKELAAGKKMSSYPKIKKILEMADKKALDSYKAFASLCDEALSKIYNEIKKCEKERQDFVNGLGKKKGK